MKAARGPLALCVLALCASVVRAGIFSDADRRPKVLWLPVNPTSLDCVATCRASGLEAIREGGTASNPATSVCALLSQLLDDFAMGTRRSSNKRCEVAFAEDDDDDKIQSAASSYHCGCVPKKGTTTTPDAVWRPRSQSCGTSGYGSYSPAPFVCRAVEGTQVFYGFEDDDDGEDECVYYKVEGGRAIAKGTSAFDRLCVPNKFAWLVASDD